MNPLFIGMVIAGIGGIAGAALIEFSARYKIPGSDINKAAIIRPCYICLWGWGFLSAIEWWLLDFVNDHPPQIDYPSLTGLVTGIAGAAIVSQFVKR